jgi:hypothetical protein
MSSGSTFGGEISVKTTIRGLRGAAHEATDVENRQAASKQDSGFMGGAFCTVLREKATFLALPWLPTSKGIQIDVSLT